MAVGLAVGGQREQPRPGRAGQAAEKLFPVGQQPLEGHGLGQGAVVEEHGDAASGGQGHGIGRGDVQGAGVDAAPDVAVVADGLGLGRSQDGETDAGGGQDLQRRRVHGGFRQPQPLGGPAETGGEVVHGPGHLQFLVEVGGQRHDDVVVDLGQGVAVPQAFGAFPVRFEDAGVGFRSRAGHPGQQGRAGVEAHPFVAVEQFDDAPRTVEPSGPGHGGIGFAADAPVPVVARRGAAFGQDAAKPGVFAGRLVKMAVDAKGAVHKRATPVRLGVRCGLRPHRDR